jgi:enamine deaminase RidA (YjgF/YER057c/UK114 family)
MKGDAVAIEHINPPGLMQPRGYSQIVTATGGKTIYIAGQGSYDADGNLVGEGDHYEQVKQAFSNLLTALDAAGATPADVVKMTIYVVGLSSEVLGAFVRGLNDATKDRPIPATASTMVGVERLAWDPMLIEIEAVAVTG